MRPRALWKGFLRLEQITCPVAAYAATSEPELVKLNRFNRATGNKIKQLNVDELTGEVIELADIATGVQTEVGKFTEITDDDKIEIAPATAAVIDCEAFVYSRLMLTAHHVSLFEDIYFLAPDPAAPAAGESFATLHAAWERDRIDQCAIGRWVRGSRERMVAIGRLGKVFYLALCRGVDEVRDVDEIFDGKFVLPKPDPVLVELTAELIRSLVPTKCDSPWLAKKFVDRYQRNLLALVRERVAGEMVKPARKPAKRPPRAGSLADAVHASIESVRKRKTSK